MLDEIKPLVSKKEVRNAYGICASKFWNELKTMGFYTKFPNLINKKMLPENAVLFIKENISIVLKEENHS